MRAILDASVALKAVLIETDSDKALRILEGHQQGLHKLLAPDVFLAEIGHALTRAERKKIIPLGDAALHFDWLVTPCPDLHASAPLMVRAIELSSHARASVYDCLYLVLAEDEHCEVITADQKFLTAFQSTGKLIDLSTL
jgi:predicted nucleic acid-binding protein